MPGAQSRSAVPGRALFFETSDGACDAASSPLQLSRISLQHRDSSLDFPCWRPPGEPICLTEKLNWARGSRHTVQSSVRALATAKLTFFVCVSVKADPHKNGNSVYAPLTGPSHHRQVANAAKHALERQVAPVRVDSPAILKLICWVRGTNQL